MVRSSSSCSVERMEVALANHSQAKGPSNFDASNVAAWAQMAAQLVVGFVPAVQVFVASNVVQAWMEVRAV